MPETNTNPWLTKTRLTLGRYDEKLLRAVAQKLLRPRSQWPVEELIDRCVETMENTVLIDRRIKELEEPARNLLGVVARSMQNQWTLAQLVELSMTLGAEDGLAPVFELLGYGFFLPDFPNLDQDESSPKPCKKPLIKTFEQWLGSPGPEGYQLYCPGLITQRASNVPLPFPEGLPLNEGDPLPVVDPLAPLRHADGFDYLLRMGAMTQRTRTDPIRKNQQGGYFKRDLEWLRSEPLVAQAPSDFLMDVPDQGPLLAEIAISLGILANREGELAFGRFPPSWKIGQVQAIREVWASLITIKVWNPIQGIKNSLEDPSNPSMTVCLASVLVLGNLNAGLWVSCESLESWLLARHPFWKGNENLRPSMAQGWLGKFLLGVVYQLGMIEVTQNLEKRHLVRLSDLGRKVLGLAGVPASSVEFPKTILVQPNLEVLAFRQGLTPGLIADLTHIAIWKSIGPACQLLLEPDSVYFALEAGWRHEELCSFIERHGTRPSPQAVLDSLKTWANKHERITIYTSATLWEFPTEKDLDNALARGLPALKVSDRFAISNTEEGVDFRNYRLTATRDYGLPPEKCVHVEPDGVTLMVDITKSDLVMETELPRFSDYDEIHTTPQHRAYQVNPQSLRRGLSFGYDWKILGDWFQLRSGHGLSPAINLLLTSPQGQPVLESMLVVHVPTEIMTDGIMQWPDTAKWVFSRLGPQAITLEKANLQKFQEALKSTSIPFEIPANI